MIASTPRARWQRFTKWSLESGSVPHWVRDEINKVRVFINKVLMVRWWVEMAEWKRSNRYSWLCSEVRIMRIVLFTTVRIIAQSSMSTEAPTTANQKFSVAHASAPLHQSIVRFVNLFRANCFFTIDWTISGLWGRIQRATSNSICDKSKWSISRRDWMIGCKMVRQNANETSAGALLITVWACVLKSSAFWKLLGVCLTEWQIWSYELKGVDWDDRSWTARSTSLAAPLKPSFSTSISDKNERSFPLQPLLWLDLYARCMPLSTRTHTRVEHRARMRVIRAKTISTVFPRMTKEIRWREQSNERPIDVWRCCIDTSANSRSREFAMKRVRWRMKSFWSIRKTPNHQYFSPQINPANINLFRWIAEEQRFRLILPPHNQQNMESDEYEQRSERGCWNSFLPFARTFSGWRPLWPCAGVFARTSKIEKKGNEGRIVAWTSFILEWLWMQMQRFQPMPLH